MNRLNTILSNLTEKELNNLRNNIHTVSNRLKGIYNIILESVKNSKDKKVKSFMDGIPKYHAQPQRTLRHHGNTRIFQPINLNKGEYWEITNREINGRIITRYKQVNIYSGASNKWQYKMVA